MLLETSLLKMEQITKTHIQSPPLNSRSFQGTFWDPLACWGYKNYNLIKI